MRIRDLHRWDVTYSEAVAIQRDLCGKLILRSRADRAAPGLIAGADVSYGRGSDLFFAAVVLLGLARAFASGSLDALAIDEAEELHSTLERVREPAVSVMYDRGVSAFAYRNRDSGQCLVALWDSSGTPGDAWDTRPAQVTVRGLAMRDPVWVDLVSGRVYELPPTCAVQAGAFTVFRDVPLYDAPVLIADRSLVLR